MSSIEKTEWYKKLKLLLSTFCRNEGIPRMEWKPILDKVANGEQLGQYENFLLFDAIGCNDPGIDVSDMEFLYKRFSDDWANEVYKNELQHRKK